MVEGCPEGAAGGPQDEAWQAFADAMAAEGATVRDVAGAVAERYSVGKNAVKDYLMRTRED